MHKHCFNHKQTLDEFIEIVLTYVNFGFLQVSNFAKCPDVVYYGTERKKNVNKLLYQGHGNKLLYQGHGQYYQVGYGVNKK